ncbi:hypothetical protein [Dactylosporangium sp. CA-092794]|uniref:hypothetical protein n=1 Tax=Dactylosporangium sp. CA-092794 TaxID=3239929 RepID=UPI003D8CCDA2
MSIYTITISPDDDSGAETTVSVDVDGGQMRIMEVTVRSASGAGLSGGRMPNVDFDLLLRAINPVRQAAEQSGAEAEPEIEEPAPRRSAQPVRSRGPAGEGKPRGSGAEGRRRQRKPRIETSVPPSALGGRVYRRMPDDLAEVYEQTQSVSAVAQHYDVPRHTAQGWMNRLRERVREQ